MQPRRSAASVAVAFAALAVSVSAGAELQLTPAGEFRARDGRPEKLAGWKIDRDIARRVIERIQARGNRTVIDYEHQSLNAMTNGQPAPAAGWFSKVEWRDGKGLYATDVEWTPRAKEMIEKKEYLYFSPVVVYDKRNGEVLDILLGAVTNVPAVEGMDEIAERMAASYGNEPVKENDMSDLLKKLYAAAGIAEGASEADAVTALAALKSKAAAAPDPAKYVEVAAMTALQAEVANLKNAAAEKDVAELVSKALTDGKLIPAQEGWAKELGKKDLAALKTYLEKAPVIVAPNTTQTRGRGPASIAQAGGDIVAAAKLEFAGSAQLKSEFSDEASYVAYRKAESEGRFKILGAARQ